MRDALLSDVRHAVRTLQRTRGFTVVAIGTLGVGLALCVAVAVLVNAYLVRGLPYPQSDRLYSVRYAPPGTPGPTGMQKLDWTSLSDVIELPIAWDLDVFNLRGGPYPEALQGTWVTPGYVEGFGIQPAIGRGFLPTDFETGRPAVALISHGLWQSRFGAQPDVLGRTFDAFMNDRPNEVESFTIIGVLPERHWHLNAFTEVLAPLRAPSFPYMVRLHRGVPPEHAAERMAALIRAGGSAMPAGWRPELISTHTEYVREIRPLLISVATATGLVLLIACANVAVLLMVRATHRRREIAVRKALGASGGQITRVVLAETLVIGGAATALGLGMAYAIVTALAPVMDVYLGRPAPGGAGALAVDALAVAAAIAAGLATVGVCSIAPLWASIRTPVSLALTGGQKGATEGPAQRRARSALIVVEVAACLALLVGAGLTIQSALRILDVDMGLRTDDVLVGSVTLRQRSYPDAPSRLRFYERMQALTGEISGVRGVAFTASWPLQQAMQREMGAGETASGFPLRAGLVAVSPGYFDTLSVPLRDGRAFTAQDRVGTEPVAIVSATLARRLWPDRSAIGEELRVAPPAGAPATARTLVAGVVGVVGDIRHAHADNDLADAYVPMLQYPSSSTFMYVRAPGRLTSIEQELRRALARIDSELALGRPQSLGDILDRQRAGTRFLASLLVVFAAFAAALALVGIYGVIAYTVRQREREIALRIAIGAGRGAITALFLRQGAIVLACGLALGVGGALAIGRVLEAQLFGVGPAEPRVIAAAAIAFALCALVAVGWPARIAASTDPAATLKE